MRPVGSAPHRFSFGWKGRPWFGSAAIIAVLALSGAACTVGGEIGAPSASPAPFARGGLLRVAVSTGVDDGKGDRGGLDPQFTYAFEGWELFRCCLLRTLLSYKGTSWDEGGVQLHPDLAVGEPIVAGDGLKWTFHLRPGQHYAPPLQDVEIAAQDIVRALEREARLGPYALYYDHIRGFEEFSNGTAHTISGLVTPDPQTLEVELTQPSGDLGYLFAMPATAPIPPIPGDPAILGAADGHRDGYGRFLVASGPYMVEGADRLDFTQPADDQVPAAGYRPGRSITFVRDPSWDADTDALRPAYPARIEVDLVSGDQAAQELESGAVDLIVGMGSDPEALVDRLRADPSTRSRVHEEDVMGVFYFTMNVALPPFDDVHVRKAVSFAIDKTAIAALLARYGEPGSIAGHIAPDALEGGLLLGFDPYRTADGGGDVSKARAEMARSPYDTDRDGRCDGPACSRLLAVVRPFEPYQAMARVVRHDLAAIGMRLRVKAFDEASAACLDPTTHAAMCLISNWEADYPSPENFFSINFGRGGISLHNSTLMGASPSQLQASGYSVREVPSIDDRLAQCAGSTGNAGSACWAGLDKYLMEEVVPWVPCVFLTETRSVSDRVAHYSFDQFANLPALDQIALTPSAIAAT